MGLIFHTSQWADSLWQGHLRYNRNANALVRTGNTKKRGFPKFAQDLHSALYLRNRPQETGNAPEWANTLLEQAEGLPEWQALKARCQARGLAAGVATEAVLDAIVSKMLDEPPPPPGQPGGNGSGQGQSNQPGGQPGGPGGSGSGESTCGLGIPGQPGGSGQGSTEDQESQEGDGEGEAQEREAEGEGAGPQRQPQRSGHTGQEAPQPTPGDAPAPIVPPDARREMRKALRQAIQQVEETDEAVEALAEMCGFEEPGSGAGRGETLHDIAQARELCKLLKTKPQLKKVAEIAGRLKRLGAAHKRARMDNAVGAVKGITLGGDLDRLLPQAIVGLRSKNRYKRLETLQTIMNRRALEYDIHGDAPAGRGPIILCVDESGSMDDGHKDVWSKAVALALLTTATEQKRAWHYIGFESYLTHEQTILPGEATPEILTSVLLRKCDGGTNFNNPLMRAMEILEESPVMRKADIIFITDGWARIHEGTIEMFKRLQKTNDVRLYVIGIGARCDVFQPIATETYEVTGRPEDQTADIAPVVVVGA